MCYCTGLHSLANKIAGIMSCDSTLLGPEELSPGCVWREVLDLFL